MLKSIIIIFFITLSFHVQSQSLPQQLKAFHQWLSFHEKEFSRCNLRKEADSIILCDGTKLSVKELQKLFKMTPKQLVDFIHQKKIGLEVFCVKEKGDFNQWCNPKIKRKMFKKRYYLQGQFLGRENTILLRGNAYKGSLIHEYIHSLQYHNAQKIYGKRYKFKRTNLEGKAIERMDEIILAAKKGEAKLKKEGKLAHLLKEMVALSQGVQKFSKWQDLIDERGIFLLYLRFGKLLGVSQQDMQLARKNMGFICKREDLPYMDKSFCPVVKKESAYVKVKNIIKEIRPQFDMGLVDKFIEGVPSRSKKGLTENIEIISKYIFTKWKIVPDLSYRSIEQKDNILPDTTLSHKRAHCVGLSTLYILSFEKMGLYAELIRIPRHVLVRVCDRERKQCEYVETLKEGKIVQKDFYFKHHYTTESEVKGTFYFSASNLLSSLYLSLGYIANQAKQYGVAEYLYKKSIDYDRRFAEGYANLSAVYQQMGKKRLAKRYNEIALKVNPKHLASMVNKAALLWNQFHEKKSKEALEILRQAQNINFNYSDIYKVRGMILEKLKKYKKSFVNYLTVVMSSSDCSYYQKLVGLIPHIKEKSFLNKYHLDLRDFAKRCSPE